MQNHLEQAKHNQIFHTCIETQFANQFYDWKITVLFYIAIHYLKALSAMRGINIGETHFDIEQNVNPDRNNATMRISKGAWREYKNLFNYSRTARYEGFVDKTTFEAVKKTDHLYCLKHLDNFIKYIESQGVVINV